MYDCTKLGLYCCLYIKNIVGPIKDITKQSLVLVYTKFKMCTGNKENGQEKCLCYVEETEVTLEDFKEN